MKFSINSSQFLKVLKRANRVVSSNPLIPILEMVVLKTEGKTLMLTTSDLARHLQTSTELEFVPDQEGVAAVDIKKLIDYLGTVPDQSITMQVDGKSMVLVHASGKAKFPLGESELFPNPHKVGDLTEVTMQLDDLLPILSSLADLANTDVAQTSGVFIGDGQMVGCDGNSIHVCPVDFHFKGECIVPKKAAQAFIQILENDPSEEIKIGINDRYTVFETDRARYTCQNVDERFVNYKPLLASERPYSLTCKRGDLMDKIKRVDVLSNKVEHIIGLEVTADGFMLFADDFAFETEASEQLDGTTTLPVGFRFGFSALKMLKHLSYFNLEEITLELVSELLPITIENEGRISVIAVMNLNYQQ